MMMMMMMMMTITMDRKKEDYRYVDVEGAALDLLSHFWSLTKVPFVIIILDVYGLVMMMGV